MAGDNVAVVMDKPEPGKQPKLSVRAIEKPQPSAGQYLVKLTLAPVNPSDVAATTLHYPGWNRAKKFPGVLGLEGTGVIEEAGEGASRFKIGQRVVSMSWGGPDGNGTWQTYTTLPEASVIPVPDSVSDEAAACFTVNPCTALGFLETLQIPEGKWLIQSAANSELGRMMISLCKHKGIKTINLVRRAEAKQELLDLGADVVISTSEEEDFIGKVKEVTNGELAYGAIDPVAGPMTGKLGSCVRGGGSVLVYGALGGITMDGIQLRDLLFRGVIITGFWLGRFMTSLPKEKIPGFLKEVMTLLAQKVFNPRAGPKFPLEKVEEAIAASQESGKSGKVYLQP